MLKNGVNFVTIQYQFQRNKCFDHNKGNYHLIVLFIHFDTWPLILTVCLYGQLSYRVNILESKIKETRALYV